MNTKECLLVLAVILAKVVRMGVIGIPYGLVSFVVAEVVMSMCALRIVALTTGILVAYMILFAASCYSPWLDSHEEEARGVFMSTLIGALLHALS